MERRTFLLKFVLIGMLFCFCNTLVLSQTAVVHHITRGADTAEIYISSGWYVDATHNWGGIFRSQDNGATITVQHKFDYDLHRNEIYGDSMPGTFYLHHYLITGDSIAVGQDYGNTITFKPLNDNGSGEFASGCRSGEFYLGNMSLPVHSLKHFTNYGDSLQIMNQNLDSVFLMDIGVQPGELFGLQWPYVVNTLGIAHSTDSGQTFSVYYQDTSIIANIQHYIFSRGTFPGELYLAGQDFDDYYHIFYSTDYGHTLTEKYIIGPYPLGPEVISFTAGRSPGSFYMVREGYITYQGYLWIYYSHDYGETFEVYYHVLDSTLSGVASRESLKHLTVYPVPSKDRITINTGENAPGILSVENMEGQECIVLPDAKSGTTVDIRALPAGVYFVRFKSKKSVTTGKFVKL